MDGFIAYNVGFFVIDELKAPGDALVPSCMTYARTMGYKDVDANLGYSCKTDMLYFGNCFFDTAKSDFEDYVARKQANIKVNVNQHSNVFQSVSVNNNK